VCPTNLPATDRLPLQQTNNQPPTSSTTSGSSSSNTWPLPRSSSSMRMVAPQRAVKRSLTRYLAAKFRRQRRSVLYWHSAQDSSRHPCDLRGG
jgi:hypothetical protein